MKNWFFTVVPDAEASAALVRAVRALGSAVAGRWALFDRLGSVVADAVVAVAGRTEKSSKENIEIREKNRTSPILPDARVWDVGRGLAVVLLLAVDFVVVVVVVVVVVDARVDRVGRETGFVAVGRVLDAVGNVADADGLVASGAVERIVVCWLGDDAFVAAAVVFGAVDGRVGLIEVLTVGRPAAVVFAVVVVVELAVVTGFAFVGMSR